MPATRTIQRVLLISLGAVAAATAWADESASRWSFGTQLGQVRGHGPAMQALSAEELSPMSFDVAATFGDKDRLGWRVFTGYRFNDYLALHVGYTDLGKVQARLVDDVPDSFAEPSRTVSQSTEGLDVGLQLKMPLSERIAVQLRGGKYYWKSRTRVAESWSAVHWSAEQSSSRSDSDDFFGAGVEVGVIDDLSATLEWTRYQVAGEPIALWTVGVLYGFSYF